MTRAPAISSSFGSRASKWWRSEISAMCLISWPRLPTSAGCEARESLTDPASLALTATRHGPCSTARVVRHLLAIGAANAAFLLGSVARASEPTNFGLPVVAADSQSSSETEMESEINNPHPDDERWLNKPFSIGLSTIMGLPTGGAGEFILLGGELAYALPYVSLAGTVGYTFGINASLAARLRLHLGHAVALTLGGRAAMLPLDAGGCWIAGEGHCEEPVRSWDEAYFGAGEL